MRVLNFHAESGDMWVSDKFDPGDGLVSDVTGIEWAEAEAKKRGLINNFPQEEHELLVQAGAFKVSRDTDDANARHVEMLARTRGGKAYVTDDIKYDVRWTAAECVGKAVAVLMDNAGLFRTCCNCDHWQKDKQLCGMWNALPPAETIVIGCDNHTDLIPF